LLTKNNPILCENPPSPPFSKVGYFSDITKKFVVHQELSYLLKYSYDKEERSRRIIREKPAGGETSAYLCEQGLQNKTGGM
jgi:hypothetical protein